MYINYTYFIDKYVHLNKCISTYHLFTLILIILITDLSITILIILILIADLSITELALQQTKKV